MEEQKELIKSIEKWLPFEIENLEEYLKLIERIDE